ncbi:UPF0524 protein C3orf70 homolog B [Callorhinchus milii]|uniref:Chromosome 3 open reading frame 70 n=1 Tax=Callorhinchus milii TaxID=7868 RepID=V9KUP2_CALMI|nr:UPF0524 protein C3orf70 homolog B [Callorhinchus milii]|eukprot:gi/632978354/ref/XP_007905865.1/ PREDICTED: UPF0524 protein C3orf70 homolog [Callorhinchus milii]
MTATPGVRKILKNDKVDEAQALARNCAGRPDFHPCDGLSICATHSHGKCFKLHWCCHLGWCHCKYIYQPMTHVEHLPSTSIPNSSNSHTDTMDLSISLMERFLKTASLFRPPVAPDSPKYCSISELFVDNYQVKRINGKMCYVQCQPQTLPVLEHTRARESCSSLTHISPEDSSVTDKVPMPQMNHCSSPSASEDSGINALGLHYTGSCEVDTEDDEDEDDLSSDEESSPESRWDQDDCSLLSPSQSAVEIIEKIETTV